MASDKGLVIGEVTSDLIQILDVVVELRSNEGAASYERVYEATSGELNLHLLSYIRFLEGEQLVTYDRISDEIEVTTQGEQVRLGPEQIRGAAAEAFAERLVDDGEEGSWSGGEQAAMGAHTQEEFADVFGEAVEGIDDAFGDGGQAPVQQQVAGGSEDGDAALDGGVSYEDSSGPEGSAKDSQVSTQATGPASDPSNSLPDEETSMNGETETPAAAAQWSAPSQESPVDQQAFERIEEIGSGGIGTVYLGRQVRLNRQVAIKEIREIFNVFAGVQRDDIIARFQSIAETQASLLHPNIVQLIDVSTTSEYPFSVMQYAPNGNLRRLIEHGKRPPLKVSLKYFLQMLHAINTAHDQGVVHGSLKPENVVLDQAGNALVTDFGISKIVEREGGRGNQVYVGVGSVAYMSPEQFQDPNLATVQSDIYSLGIMLYEMLTGKVPGRRSPMPSSFYPDIPRTLDDIFDQMSMDREEDRYDAVDEIIVDLHRSEAVLDLLDKRSGVLFLRDPMTHGELGLGEDVELDVEPSGGGEGAAVVTDEELKEEGESVADEVEEEEAQEVGGDTPQEEDEASDVEESAEEDEAAEDDEGSDDGSDEDGDVLDKLDKYGEMFDD